MFVDVLNFTLNLFRIFKCLYHRKIDKERLTSISKKSQSQNWTKTFAFKSALMFNGLPANLVNRPHSLALNGRLMLR